MSNTKIHYFDDYINVVEHNSVWSTAYSITSVQEVARCDYYMRYSGWRWKYTVFSARASCEKRTFRQDEFVEQEKL